MEEKTIKVGICTVLCPECEAPHVVTNDTSGQIDCKECGETFEYIADF